MMEKELDFILMEPFMKVIWLEIKNKEKVRLFIKMNLCFKDNGKMTSNVKELTFIIGRIRIISTKAYGVMVFRQEKANISTLQEVYMMGKFKIIKDTVMVLISIRMEMFMKELGSKITNREKENSYLLMKGKEVEMFIKEISIKANFQGLAIMFIENRINNLLVCDFFFFGGGGVKYLFFLYRILEK